MESFGKVLNCKSEPVPVHATASPGEATYTLLSLEHIRCCVGHGDIGGYVTPGSTFHCSPSRSLKFKTLCAIANHCRDAGRRGAACWTCGMLRATWSKHARLADVWQLPHNSTMAAVVVAFVVTFRSTSSIDRTSGTISTLVGGEEGDKNRV